MSDLRTIFFGLLCSLLSQGQLRDQPARRDQPPWGAVSISGRVQAAGTGGPIQGAVILLVTAPVTESHSSGRDIEGARIDGRTATTDASGGFSFTGVAPGAYRLIVSPAFHQGRYLPSGIGASRPNDPGRTITVRAGEDISDLTLTLPAGVAIEGRVMDEAGEPFSRMSVIAARVMAGSDRVQRIGHEERRLTTSGAIGSTVWSLESTWWRSKAAAFPSRACGGPACACPHRAGVDGVSRCSIRPRSRNRRRSGSTWCPGATR